MDYVLLDTDPFLTTLHQLVHHPHPDPESDLERKIKRQRRESRDHEERRHVTIATPVDVKENKDAYLFIADVPGLRKSDIEVIFFALHSRLSLYTPFAPSISVRRVVNAWECI